MAQWQATNDAIMAFLAGSQLASHTLQLTDGSDRLLPEIFPGVPHIGRFNLRTAKAREVLVNADMNLARMAIPQILALHEDYIFSCLCMLVEARRCSKTKYNKASIKSVHEKFAECCTGDFRCETLEQFELLRCIRNCLIHENGSPNGEFDDAVRAMSTKSDADWQRYTGRSPADLSDPQGALDIRHFEMIATLAITKRLRREVNQLMRDTLSEDEWIDIAYKDFIIDKRPKNAVQFRTAFHGFVGFHYRVLNIPADKLDNYLARVPSKN